MSFGLGLDALVLALALVIALALAVLALLASVIAYSLHFALGIAEAKCILATAVCVSLCLSVCLSFAAFPHYCTDPDVSWGNGSGYPLVVHYWADLQSLHGFRCYDNISPNTKCQRVLVLALWLVDSSNR